MVNFGIGYTDVFVSVWSVVMAINRLPEFYISYPVCHKKQREIAASCCEASCVVLDLILIALVPLMVFLSGRTCQQRRMQGMILVVSHSYVRARQNLA